MGFVLPKLPKVKITFHNFSCNSCHRQISKDDKSSILFRGRPICLECEEKLFKEFGITNTYLNHYSLSSKVPDRQVLIGREFDENKPIKTKIEEPISRKYERKVDNGEEEI